MCLIEPRTVKNWGKSMGHRLLVDWMVVGVVAGHGDHADVCGQRAF